MRSTSYRQSFLRPVERVLLALIAATFLHSSAFATEQEWKTTKSSPSAQIEVEKVLYKKLGSNVFFVHVRVKNNSGHPLVIDLNNRNSVFYPNQWAASNEPKRTTIDESRIDQSHIKPAEKFKLEFDLPSSTRIATGKTFDYFISFNSGSFIDIEQSA